MTAIIDKEATVSRARATTRSMRSLVCVTAILLVGFTLASCGGSGDDAATTTNATTTAAPANVVHLSLTESDGGRVQGVEADRTTFTAGVSYHFVVDNTGSRSHELMIIEPMEPGSMDMEELDELALYVVEADDLEPGASVEFDYAFPADAVGANLEFGCYLEGHYEAGMHTAITVEG